MNDNMLEAQSVANHNTALSPLWICFITDIKQKHYRHSVVRMYEHKL